VADVDKTELPELGQKLASLGFSLVATRGTAAALREQGCVVTEVNKVAEGSPHIVDLLGEGKVQLVVNTPESSDGPRTASGSGKTIDSLLDSRSIRLVATEMGIPVYTTMAAALAGAYAIESLRRGDAFRVLALQDYHATLVRGGSPSAELHTSPTATISTL
jgi:carbamoyl-phosphate synthase large subunit